MQINNIDVRRYDPADLNRYISMLFQTTDKRSVTNREFLRWGDIATPLNDARLWEAAEQSGAAAIIKSFPQVRP